ncbi:MAG TPA: hypothetical protein DCL44_08135 [Elusimicrobia bacterium]|nr:hypothetical protein [Elusimicrobiota bacterium]
MHIFSEIPSSQLKTIHYFPASSFFSKPRALFFISFAKRFELITDWSAFICHFLKRYVVPYTILFEQMIFYPLFLSKVA